MDGRILELKRPKVPEQEATVRRVPDGDPELLRYLARLGIVRTARVRMVGKEPFQGKITELKVTTL